MKRTLLFAITVICLCSCSKKSVQHFEGQAFGTLYSITYLGDADPGIKEKTDSVLEELSGIFSIFDTNSTIFKFNLGEDAGYNEDFIRVLRLSKEISMKTDGAFDCTVQPLVHLWGFGKDGVRHTVSDDTLAEIRRHIGIELIDIQEDKTIKRDSSVQLNFNAIAKGYAVDRIADLLESCGHHDCLVEIGGEIAARGMKNGKPWRVGIQAPCENAGDAAESFQAFDLAGGRAVATSGNYRNYFEEGGVRYTHILDPRTGKPGRTNLLSVSVIAPDCATADAYATAFMVLGFDKSADIVRNNPNLEAWFIIAENEKDWRVERVGK